MARHIRRRGDRKHRREVARGLEGGDQIRGGGSDSMLGYMCILWVERLLTDRSQSRSAGPCAAPRICACRSAVGVCALLLWAVFCGTLYEAPRHAKRRSVHSRCKGGSVMAAAWLPSRGLPRVPWNRSHCAERRARVGRGLSTALGRRGAERRGTKRRSNRGPAALVRFPPARRQSARRVRRASSGCRVCAICDSAAASTAARRGDARRRGARALHHHRPPS